jgi:hypothetical protein
MHQDLQTLLRCHMLAFTAIGGVPIEILYDRMKTAVTGEDGDGHIIYNRSLIALGQHYGFLPRACRPYRAKTKGKVERPVRYVRSNFFYGREFVSDADLNEQAERWLRITANVRIHATTKERPVERFERDERLLLQPLAARPYRPLVLLPAEAQKPSRVQGVPSVQVERRPLSAYTRIAAGAR